MDDQSDDRKKVTGPRVEVVTRSGNRRWPDELKAQIVAVSHLPGAVVAEVARHGPGARLQELAARRNRRRTDREIVPHEQHRNPSRFTHDSPFASLTPLPTR